MHHIQFVPGQLATTIQAFYSRRDYYLVYSHRLPDIVRPQTLADVINERLRIPGPRPVLLCADTLVLTFSGEGKQLTAIDGYTNWKYWKRTSEIAVPAPQAFGRIRLADVFDDNDVVSLSLRTVPNYLYAPDQGLLRITFSRSSEEPQFYRVSNQLVVGLCRGALSRLFIEDLLIK